MKQKAKYSKRFLAVLLAMLMLLAAAQPVSFVAAAGNDPDPAFGEGAVASARYTTGGALELSFSEATSQGGGALTYYIDFYDLDMGYEQRGVPVNDNPVALTDILRTYDSVSLVSATISAQQIKELGLNMSHRISIAITAVDSDGWRSQPLEALVGESLAIPSANSAPTDTQFALFEDFEGETAVGGNENTGTPYKWMYNGTYCDEQTGNDNLTPANIDGIGFGDGQLYETPGLNASHALRVYMKNAENSAFASGSTPSSVAVNGQSGYQRLDVGYTKNRSQFINANELWIWVDASYVSFDELALQVKYLDRTGTVQWWRDNSGIRDGNNAGYAYSADSYSTVGYATRNNGDRVPIYYQNEDGLWDTWYTNESGYLEGFGHYRGFLRVDLKYLQNENASSQYVSLTDARPYSFTIEGWANWYHGGWWNDGSIGNLTAATAAEEMDRQGHVDWWGKNDTGGARGNGTLDVNKFYNQVGISSFKVAPINDIASVGITWKGASADSVNKSFYIDQIGFSGTGMDGNVQSVTDLTASNTDMVQALVDQYLPADKSTVNISHASVIEDLRTICTQLGVDNDDLRQAEQALQDVLAGAEDPVSWLSTRMGSIDTVSVDVVKSYFNLYQTFTLGDIYRFGTANEAKLITAYNNANLSEWYPAALRENFYFKSFNDLETGYTMGQTALHEYDDYRQIPGTEDYYYNRGHLMDWNNAGRDITGAWENSRNLVAYSRIRDAEDAPNDQNQRFGLGVTTIGRTGFDNSLSVDTSFYRDTLKVGNQYENYRIALTYGGADGDNWSQIPAGNFTNADWFVFYADFTELTDIRKIWIYLRTGDGTAYSHGEDNSVWDYGILDLDAVNPQWTPQSTDDDGCLTNALNGFRGFIRIPMDHFYEYARTKQNAGEGDNKLLNTGKMNDIRQVKVFISGSDTADATPAGTSIALDEFGFATSTPQSGFVQLQQDALQTPDYDTETVDSVKAAILGLYEDVTLLGETESTSDYLFNYAADTYAAMLSAYHTLTVAQKAELEADGAVQGKIADMAAFVRNYEPYGGVDGNLAKYVADAKVQYNTVITDFRGDGLSEEEKSAVVSALDTYDDYPAKYQNAVLTYWADRNLSAVFPNFTVTTQVHTEEHPLITMELSGENYTGSGTLDFYAAAAASPYDVQLEIPSTVDLLMGDEKITVPITGQVINPTDPGTMNFILSIAETDVQNSGVYTGSFVVQLLTPVADTGTGQASNTLGSDGVPNAEDYRMETYTVYVKLICEASYTVVIPADVAVEWGTQGPVNAGALEVTDMFIPTAASIKVGVDSANAYKMVYGSFELPYDYELQEDGELFREATFDMTTEDLKKELQVEVPDWPGAPSDQYKDTLTFTVTYSEQ